MTTLSWLPSPKPTRKVGDSENGLPIRPPTPSEFFRFVGKIDPSEGDDGCWLWTDSPAPEYGVFWLEGRTLSSHRTAYTWFVGPIPRGHTLDHLCRNKFCVNPYHLEPVRNRENISRGYGAKQTSSRFTGVSWNKGKNKWRTQIRMSGYRRILEFNDELDAALAYDKALVELGLPARNFPSLLEAAGVLSVHSW